MLPKNIYFKFLDSTAYQYNSSFEYRRDLVKKRITENLLAKFGRIL